MSVSELSKQWLRFHEQRGAVFNFACGLLLSALVGGAEHFLGKDFSPAIFYLLPIAFSAWFAGRVGGIFISLLCSVIWIWSKSYNSIINLKFFSVFGTYCVVSLLVAKIRQMLEHERAMSRIDPLTGTVNRRAFTAAALTEIARMTRSQTPLTAVYIDLDNFKEINDRYGHSTGDLLLQTVATCLLTNLRRTDVVARLGGDEFVILLPNTGQDAARSVVPEIVGQLRSELNEHSWPTTLSVGVLTCLTPPQSTDQMLTLADNAMYGIKKQGKDGIRYEVYGEQAPAAALRRGFRGGRGTPTRHHSSPPLPPG